MIHLYGSKLLKDFSLQSKIIYCSACSHILNNDAFFSITNITQLKGIFGGFGHGKKRKTAPNLIFII